MRTLAIGVADAGEMGLAPRGTSGNVSEDIGLGLPELGEHPTQEFGIDAARVAGVRAGLCRPRGRVAVAPLRGCIAQVVPGRVEEVYGRVAMAA